MNTSSNYAYNTSSKAYGHEVLYHAFIYTIRIINNNVIEICLWLSQQWSPQGYDVQFGISQIDQTADSPKAQEGLCS